MLQQTQVATVVAYFDRFVTRFPSIESLAAAPMDEVLSYWTGLGYYARARNLHRAACQILERHAGKFPTTLQELIELPGLARSTASAILAIVDNQKLAILDGNVKRVLARFFEIKTPVNDPKTQQILWELAESLLPTARMANYTQAIMDLGATVCVRVRPKCLECPFENTCQGARHQTTHLYPLVVTRKVQPTKSVFFVLLITPNCHVFLRQRPTPGWWGGLWVFPMYDNEEEAENWIKKNVPKVESIEKLPTAIHVFTHFKLSYRTLCVGVHSQIELPQGRWFNALEALPVGVPTPIEKLMAQARKKCDLSSVKN